MSSTSWIHFSYCKVNFVVIIRRTVCWCNRRRWCILSASATAKYLRYLL